jgi:membrane protease YdiL (CAAX protease family)
VAEGQYVPERHSLRRTIALHLAPGLLLAFVFWLAAAVVNRAGGSSYLALLLCIPLVLAPVEVGILIAERRRTGVSWRHLVAPLRSARVSIPETLLSALALYVVAMIATLPAAPTRQVILRAAEQWLPSWAIFNALPAGISPGTLWLGLLLSGVVAPIVEELYFRGFLLPRIPAPEACAPAVNAALFSIYHFFSPWAYGPIFVASLPLAYYVRLKGNLLPVIITHSLFNSVGVIAALVRPS